MDGIVPHWTKTASDVPGLDTTKLYEALKNVHKVHLEGWRAEMRADPMAPHQELI